MAHIPVDTNQQGTGPTWSTSQLVSAPGPMVLAGDFLRLSATTTDATGGLTLNGRLLTRDGKLVPFSLGMTFSGTGVQTAVTTPLMDGWIMGFTCYVSTGTITDGEVQATVDVVQSSGTGATPVMCLASGEVTNLRKLGLNAYDVIAAGTGGGNLIGTQIITTTGAGTYTPTANTSWIVVQLQAGGGGGAGIATPSVNQVNLGGGGGGGGFVQKKLTANFSGASYSVGAKGAGGAAGNNNGNAGSNTTFTDTAGSPTTYTAGGGGGGIVSTTLAPPFILCGGDNAGTPNGAGGTATGGDINIVGGPSGNAHTSSATSSYSGRGGASFFSHETRGVYATSGATIAGVNATGKGGGGSGAMGASTGGANRAGGDGGDGQIVIYEYA